MTVNKVILVGNLGRDPESRQTNNGTAVATLNIATTERRKQPNGDWADHTEWHRVTLFGRTAENAARFLSKGRQVYVEGKLRTTKYQDRETGKDRYSTDIVADVVHFLGGRGEGGDSGGRGGNFGGRGDSSGGRNDSYNDGYDSFGGGNDSDDSSNIPF